MRGKAIQDLVQLSDNELFLQIEEGARLCESNAKRLADDSTALDDLRRVQGAEILRIVSEEEAAKVLILLDAVRCPRARHEEAFARQLNYFNDHLAKGIYAQYSGMKPASFGEVREWIELERKEYYLDGPNGIEWMFYNDILHNREAPIYVDYTESDGDHTWQDPAKFCQVPFRLRAQSSAIFRLVSSLSVAGFLRASALAVIAELWRPIEMCDDFSWDRLRELNATTLDKLNQDGLLNPEAAHAHTWILEEWLFPLHSLDLRKERVAKTVLREMQARWSPYPE
jgi:AbiV family abortive infection protein